MGVVIGLFLTVTYSVVISMPSNEEMLSKGPANTGHEELQCQDCHTKAKGNAMQQFQANFMHLVGARKNEVTFGHEDVDTKKCQSCHDRPNDRHPVHRFKEPRFSDATKVIDARDCETCHKEHAGVRLTVANTSYCVNCHSDLDMKDDPLDVPHVALIKDEKWETCLQCHDFHGNHFMKTADKMKDTIPMTEILQYVKGGKDPYSKDRKYVVVKEGEVYVEKKHSM